MSEITCSYDGAIAVLRLANEAKLNALTMTMLRQLEDHLTAVERAPEIRAVILTGAGPKAFCCGADIAEWGPLSPADFARFWVCEGHRVFDRLATLSKPTIGALNGHAFGGGLELAACCDIRVLAPRTTLALPEGKVGIVPGWSGTQRLTRLLPEPVVKEMALFGRRITAERAQALGFSADISEDVLTAANDIARSLQDMSPRANMLAKAMIHGAVGEDRAAAIEVMASAAAAASDDRNEGVTAFLEKRAPKFTGL
ncbi:enoyl-CoA hydratase/isomerase family protein [Marivita hallyeonensis]|uniref:Enoyl-CoA hydratase/carnithine racemase n=1 Tax=Marivita hallyeonensis TaxID=996342 RepID=A0A1M5R3U9_9RHOB|nr:enoyl-CoA hydratase/isomerase family protein [Marivita hallyeonensis]SHH20453.1 Enoyl-CoA hydratase/carnithine racemase [Marivita hallyeonensis]